MGVIVSVLFYLFGIFFCLESINANRFYEIIPKPFICKVLDSDLIYNYTCNSKDVNRALIYHTREINFKPDVSLRDYHIKVQILRKFGSSFRAMLEIEQDMCDFTKGASTRGSSLLNKVLNKDGRKKFGNMFDPCPLSGYRYEKDAIIDYSAMPEVVPAGEYLVNITGYTVIDGSKKPFILTQCYVDVRSKKTRKSSK